MYSWFTTWFKTCAKLYFHDWLIITNLVRNDLHCVEEIWPTSWHKNVVLWISWRHTILSKTNTTLFSHCCAWCIDVLLNCGSCAVIDWREWLFLGVVIIICSTTYQKKKKKKGERGHQELLLHDILSPKRCTHVVFLFCFLLLFLLLFFF